MKINEAETWLSGIDHLDIFLVRSMRLLLPAAAGTDELIALLTTEMIEADGINFEKRMLWTLIVEDLFLDEVLSPFAEMADSFV